MWDEKELFANADFFHASAYNAMGIPEIIHADIRLLKSFWLDRTRYGAAGK